MRDTGSGILYLPISEGASTLQNCIDHWHAQQDPALRPHALADSPPVLFLCLSRYRIGENVESLANANTCMDSAAISLTKFDHVLVSSFGDSPIQRCAAMGEFVGIYGRSTEHIANQAGPVRLEPLFYEARPERPVSLAALGADDCSATSKSKSKVSRCLSPSLSLSLARSLSLSLSRSLVAKSSSHVQVKLTGHVSNTTAAHDARLHSE